MAFEVIARIPTPEEIRELIPLDPALAVIKKIQGRSYSEYFPWT